MKTSGDIHFFPHAQLPKLLLSVVTKLILSSFDTPTSMADELKALGNKAIAEKNFDEAM